MNSENSVLSIAKVVKEWQVKDQNTGEIITKRQLNWEKAIQPISLGSNVKPNKEIVQIKYNIPQKRGGIEDIFSNLFR